MHPCFQNNNHNDFASSFLLCLIDVNFCCVILATTSSFVSTCADYEFTCKSDGLCIPLPWQCDFTPDCADKSDEVDCGIGSSVQNKCDSEDFFHCKYSQKCIPKAWLCDNVHDCGLIGKFSLLDPSDEDKSQNCTKICPRGTLSCSNGVCLPISKFCDGSIDCPDDEFSCDGNRMACKSLKCDYDCKLTPHGPYCFCPQGQEVVNSTKCVVNTVCTEDSLTGEVCDQTCINAPSDNKCSCVEGFERINSRCLGINCKCCLFTFQVHRCKNLTFLQHPLLLRRCYSC